MKAIEVDESLRWGKDVFDMFLSSKYSEKMFEKPIKIKKLIKIKSQNCPINSVNPLQTHSSQVKVSSNT